MQTQIEQKVMASVGTIYAVRQLMSITALKLYVLCASLIAIASLVSIPSVFANLMHVGPTGLATFALAAALNTKILVQVGLLLCVIVMGSFIADAFRVQLRERAFG